MFLCLYSCITRADYVKARYPWVESSAHAGNGLKRFTIVWMI